MLNEDNSDAASTCSVAADVGDVFSLTGNNSSVARLVNLTLNITHIFPICPSDGIWNATFKCTVSKTESCFNNATLSKSMI